MVIDTLRFGMLELPESVLVTLPDGLLGFPECRRFVVLPYDDEMPLCWLQSADDPEVAFLALEPHLFFAEYEVMLSDSDTAALGLAKAEDATLLSLLTVSRDAHAITANLAGPIVVNVITRRGKQIVLDDARYSTKHLVAQVSARLASATRKSQAP
jgi:flagellar assembly factor FliW